MEGHRRLVRVEGSSGRLHRRGEELRVRLSREHAPIAIKASGASAVIARSFARIFYRNAFNMGLPIFEAPDAVDEIEAGDRLAVDMERGPLRNETKGKEYRFTPIPPFMRGWWPPGVAELHLEAGRRVFDGGEEDLRFSGRRDRSGSRPGGLSVLRIIEQAAGKQMFETEEGLLGGASYDAHGVPMAPNALALAKRPTRCCWARWEARSGTPSRSPSVPSGPFWG